MKLIFKLSPCPNDTFMFDAMINGRIDTEGLEFDVSFDDIESLNHNILYGAGADVSKISYAAFAQIASRYVVLRSGSALGRGNGPLLVGREGVDIYRTDLSVAVPGMQTTANLLLEGFFPNIKNKTPMLFSDIAQAVARGDFDCGVLIHEGRFTYARHGLVALADLGQLWEEASAMPLPLGAIVVSRSLPVEVARKVERVLMRSVEYAMQNPKASEDFVRSHAAEISSEVIESHISLFVNDFSVLLGEKGEQAVAQLLSMPVRKIFIE